jgi:hypothetical protein
MTTLEQWEADASIHYVNHTLHPFQNAEDLNNYNKRILALIDLIRKKDAALKALSRKPTHRPDTVQICSIAEEAIALTENIK